MNMYKKYLAAGETRGEYDVRLFEVKEYDGKLK